VVHAGHTEKELKRKQRTSAPNVLHSFNAIQKNCVT